MQHRPHFHRRWLSMAPQLLLASAIAFAIVPAAKKCSGTLKHGADLFDISHIEQGEAIYHSYHDKDFNAAWRMPLGPLLESFIFFHSGPLLKGIFSRYPEQDPCNDDIKIKECVYKAVACLHLGRKNDARRHLEEGLNRWRQAQKLLQVKTHDERALEGRLRSNALDGFLGQAERYLDRSPELRLAFLRSMLEFRPKDPAPLMRLVQDLRHAIRIDPALLDAYLLKC